MLILLSWRLYREVKPLFHITIFVSVSDTLLYNCAPKHSIVSTCFLARKVKDIDITQKNLLFVLYSTKRGITIRKSHRILHTHFSISQIHTILQPVVHVRSISRMLCDLMSENLNLPAASTLQSWLCHKAWPFSCQNWTRSYASQGQLKTCTPASRSLSPNTWIIFPVMLEVIVHSL